jgi:hypothetical protein
MSKSRNQKARTQRSRVRPSLAARTRQSERPPPLDPRAPDFGARAREQVLEADLSAAEKVASLRSLIHHRPELGFTTIFEICALQAEQGDFHGGDQDWLPASLALDELLGHESAAETELLAWQRPEHVSPQHFDQARLQVIGQLLQTNGAHGEATTRLLFQLELTDAERITALSVENVWAARRVVELAQDLHPAQASNPEVAWKIAKILDYLEEILETASERPPEVLDGTRPQALAAHARNLRQQVLVFWEDQRLSAESPAEKVLADSESTIARIMLRANGEPFHHARIQATMKRFEGQFAAASGLA